VADPGSEMNAMFDEVVGIRTVSWRWRPRVRLKPLKYAISSNRRENRPQPWRLVADIVYQLMILLRIKAV